MCSIKHVQCETREWKCLPCWPKLAWCLPLESCLWEEPRGKAAAIQRPWTDINHATRSKIKPKRWSLDIFKACWMTHFWASLFRAVMDADLLSDMKLKCGPFQVYKHIQYTTWGYWWQWWWCIVHSSFFHASRRMILQRNSVPTGIWSMDWITWRTIKYWSFKGGGESKDAPTGIWHQCPTGQVHHDKGSVLDKNKEEQEYGWIVLWYNPQYMDMIVSEAHHAKVVEDQM